jgi:LEA14-like dessication related protein
MKNLAVENFSEEEVRLTGAAILHNPNSYSISVKEIDIFVRVDDQAVGKVNQIGEVKVPANAEFEVPLNVSFAPEEVYDNLLSGLISYIMKGEFEVYYKGFIKIKVSGLVFKVPVDHKANVKI